MTDFPATLPDDLKREILRGAHWLPVWQRHCGVTDAELANRSGIPMPRIREIATDATYPNYDEIEALAAVLGTTAEEIIAIQD